MSFVSPVGNNDVPYPYAVDREGRVYLLIDNVVLTDAAAVAPFILSDGSDPYSYYYEQGLMTTDRGSIPPTQPKHPHFRGIDTYYIGNKMYTLRYHPNPGQDYDSTRTVWRYVGEPTSGDEAEEAAFWAAFAPPTPVPAAQFRLPPSYSSEEDMSVVTTDGQRHVLSRQDYIDLMEAFGHMLGFERLQRGATLQARLD